MNCNDLRQRIEATCFQLDGAAAVHLRTCELCRAWFQNGLLEAALKQDPVPPPSPGFENRVILNAVADRPASAATSGRRIAAVAATLLIAVAAWIAWLALPAYGPSEVHPEPRVLQVVIEAKEHRQGALVTLDLSQEVELEGFGDQRHIEWRTDLVKGRNLLKLPVKIMPGKRPGEIKVALSYNGDGGAEMRIPVGA